MLAAGRLRSQGSARAASGHARGPQRSARKRRRVVRYGPRHARRDRVLDEVHGDSRAVAAATQAGRVAATSRAPLVVGRAARDDADLAEAAALRLAIVSARFEYHWRGSPSAAGHACPPLGLASARLCHAGLGPAASDRLGSTPSDAPWRRARRWQHDPALRPLAGWRCGSGCDRWRDQGRACRWAARMASRAAVRMRRRCPRE